MIVTKKRIGLLLALAIIVVGYILPESLQIPVQGAATSDWNENTFWYAPWGKSGVHKGIDIFSEKGRASTAPTHGVVLYAGTFARGGKVVILLGPKWRLHYLAHLDSFKVRAFTAVRSGEIIGSVGDSGNAKNKPPHLHYSIVTLIPYLWRFDSSTQGWKKIFYLDPNTRLRAASRI